MKAYDEIMMITYVILFIIKGHLNRNQLFAEFEIKSS